LGQGWVYDLGDILRILDVGIRKTARETNTDSKTIMINRVEPLKPRRSLKLAKFNAEGGEVMPYKDPEAKRRYMARYYGQKIKTGEIPCTAHRCRLNAATMACSASTELVFRGPVCAVVLVSEKGSRIEAQIIPESSRDRLVAKLMLFESLRQRHQSFNQCASPVDGLVRAADLLVIHNISFGLQDLHQVAIRGQAGRTLP
jgi:hypothetical protein